MTIHEHLDGTVSIRYGPHVVGQFNEIGENLRAVENRARKKGGGKDGPVEESENHKTGFPTLPPSLGNPAEAGFPLSHRPGHCGFSLPENQESAFGEQTRLFGSCVLMRTDDV